MYNFFFIDNITYRDLFDALRNFQPHLKPCSSDARLFLYSYIGQKINFSIDEKYEIILNNKILGFVTTLNRKWVAVNRTATIFMTKNEEWLNTKFVLSQNENEPVDCRGRPSKSFSDLSERSKTRKVKSLVETTSPERLLRATRVSLFKQGKHAAADLLKQSTEYSPDRPVKIRKTFRKSQEKTDLIPYTVDEALAHMVNCRMTNI